jgi:predicted GNAT family acetyltransferase
MVDRRLPLGDFWIWTDDRAVSVAALSSPVAGVARVQCVYTPSAQRGRGYAGACVADLSALTLASGHRPILYTDLGNPTSNSVYRRIGFRAVAEGLVYRFD